MSAKEKSLVAKEKTDFNCLLELFTGECGHKWIGASGGFYGCPVCGLYDGDHHLLSAEAIAVQPEDWGTAWEELARESDRLFQEHKLNDRRNDLSSEIS
jgi:hypothetical protein